MEQSQTHHLRHQSMLPLFMSASVPIAISMLMAGLYNVVDAIFIARWLGTNAMGGVSMVMPLQVVIAALASMISTGAASLLARHVGAHDLKAAARIATASFYVCGVFIAVMTIGGVLLTPWILTSLGVTEILMPYAEDYVYPILLGSFAPMLLPLMADIFRSEGKMKIMMVMILMASFLNIILDPIFIFVLGLGVKGAAIATILAQCCSLFYAYRIYHKGNTLIRLSRVNRWGMGDWGGILALGIPIFIAQLGMAVQTALMNYLIQSMPQVDGNEWVGIIGIHGRVFTFMFLPLIAMLVAFQTICGFNYGAKMMPRVKSSIICALGVMSVYGLLVGAFMLLFAEPVYGLFTQDERLLELAREIVNITVWTFPLIGFMMLSTGFYQAVGKAKAAIFYSGFRVFLILIPVMLYLANQWGIFGVLVAFPIADVLSVVVIIAFCTRSYLSLSRHSFSREESLAVKLY